MFRLIRTKDERIKGWARVVKKEIQQYILEPSGDLTVTNEPIVALPNNLNYVEGSLLVSGTMINKLPENLVINGNLFANYTKINELPKNLIVKGNLWLFETPISEKYTIRELKEEYPNILGNVYM